MQPGCALAEVHEFQGFPHLFIRILAIYSKEKKNTMANTGNPDYAKLNLYIKFLKEQIAFEPGSAALHYNLGLAYTHRGLTAEAISEFKQALECDPKLAQAYVNLGGLYAESDPEKSIEANTKALEIDPNLGPAHSNLAYCYLREGNFEKAVIHGQKAMELMPGSPKAYQLLAAAYIGSGELEASAELSRKTIAEGVSPAAAHFNLSIALRALGREEEAEEHTRAARELGYVPEES